MANHKLFPEITTEPKKVGNSMSTAYTLDASGMLTIFWNGKTINMQGIKPGMPMLVECNGSLPIVRKMSIPRGSSNLLMWLCGVPRELRAYDRKKFDEICRDQAKKNDWWNYERYSCRGTGDGYEFEIASCNRSDCGGIHILGAFINGVPNKTCAKEILSRWKRVPFPQEFVERTLQNRFGFTPEDIQELRAAMTA